MRLFPSLLACIVSATLAGCVLPPEDYYYDGHGAMHYRSAPPPPRVHPKPVRPAPPKVHPAPNRPHPPAYHRPAPPKIQPPVKGRPNPPAYHKPAPKIRPGHPAVRQPVHRPAKEKRRGSPQQRPGRPAVQHSEK